MSTWLRLGRVSNLPTVISNALVGLLLMGAAPSPAWALVFAAMSCFYVGGMFLNDAFDHRWDARFAPSRPIPRGEVGARSVYVAGAATLLLGVVLLVSSTSRLEGALLGGCALSALIVLYDAWHKGNPLSPLLMGACRVMVVLAAALSVSGALPASVWMAALALCAHLIGLTYAAKQEHLRTHWWPLVFLLAPLLWGAWLGVHALGVWPYWLALAIADGLALRKLFRREVPRAVALFIASISLVDAMALAAHGHARVALACAVCFAATLQLQGWVRGT
ncbi:MAG: UbiA family prenyltransferase [Polyangiales bacterium]